MVRVAASGDYDINSAATDVSHCVFWPLVLLDVLNENKAMLEKFNVLQHVAPGNGEMMTYNRRKLA